MNFRLDPNQPCRFLFLSTVHEVPQVHHDHEEYDQVWFEVTAIKHIINNAIGPIVVIDPLPETIEAIASPDAAAPYLEIVTCIRDNLFRLEFEVNGVVQDANYC